MRQVPLLAHRKLGLVTLAEWLASVREPWMRDALCHEYPSHLFFPTHGVNADQAKAICGRCLVRAECLAYALRDPDACANGIWAGTTPRERKALKRERTVAA
jgi:WhiB family redox-sensing transcriptional regulator